MADNDGAVSESTSPYMTAGEGRSAESVELKVFSPSAVPETTTLSAKLAHLNSYVLWLTLSAGVGGLLFGYDTGIFIFKLFET